MKSGSGEWLSIEDLMEKISNKSIQERKEKNVAYFDIFDNMSQANHLPYSARMRGRSKQPTYTSDKRAKFTQKENKKWVRLVTVIGYIIAVSLPALSLSIYYIYVWDQNHTNMTANSPPMVSEGPVHKFPIIHNTQSLNLKTILSESLSSMESRDPAR